MKYIVITFLILASFPIILYSQDIEGPADWPQFQYNAQHVGHNPNDWTEPPLELDWNRKLMDAPIGLMSLVGDRVLVTPWKYKYSLTDDNATIWCLNANTGETIWEHQYTDELISSIAPPSYADGLVYVHTNGNISHSYIDAFDLETGELIWFNRVVAQWEEQLTPTVYNNQVFAAGNIYGGLHSFDAITGDLLWLIKTTWAQEWTPAVYGNVVYTNLDGKVTAWEAETGAKLWEIRLVEGDGFQPHLQGNAPVIDTTNGILFALQDEYIHAIDLETHEVLWDVWNASIRTTPAVYNNQLFLLDERKFKVRDVFTGEVIWSYQNLADQYRGVYPPVVSNGYVYTSTLSSIYVFNIETHELVWQFPIGGHLAIGNGRFFVGTHYGYIYAFSSVATDIDGNGLEILPENYILCQNYPNPFNPSTRIEYALPKKTHVKLTVYNSLGQEIRTLVNQTIPAGTHMTVWNGTDNSENPVSSGVYFYKLESDNFVDSKKMILVR